MNVIHEKQVNQMPVIWLAVALALFTALAYAMIELKVLSVGDLRPEEGSSAIVYTAAASYLLGGLLILLRRRWLWVIGALINGLVLLFFVNLYWERPAVLLSPGGIVSKTGQLLLEVGLIYLIVKDWYQSRRMRKQRANSRNP